MCGQPPFGQQISPGNPGGEDKGGCRAGPRTPFQTPLISRPEAINNRPYIYMSIDGYRYRYRYTYTHTFL